MNSALFGVKKIGFEILSKIMTSGTIPQAVQP